MTSNFQLTDRADNIKILTFDRQDNKMNILSSVVLLELEKILDDLTNDNTCRGLVFVSGKKSQFIVGADIKEIDAMSTPEEAIRSCQQMEKIISKLASCSFPTVSAVHGPCLGGGLELILCCTYRIASDSSLTKFAAPEIKLGLIPGAGGTQRLPRLIGISAGLDMILTGRNYPSKKAAGVGLVDAVVPETVLLDVACQYALKNGGKKRPTHLKKLVPQLVLEKNALGRKIVARKAREEITKNTKGFYPAAYKALEAVVDGLEMPLAKGLLLEANLFSQLVCTRECQSLIHLFEATTSLKKNPYLDKGRAKFGEQGIDQIGVIGAGFMGSGLTTLTVDRGCNVLVSDPDSKAVAKLLQHASSYFLKKVKRRRLKKFQHPHKLAMISPATTTVGFNTCDLIIEAVYEDLDLKRRILAELEQQIADDRIFASNTSALPISEIAEGAKHPQRVIGMHFFSPVEKMPLLEIVVTSKTAPWVISRAVEFGQMLGKQVIIVQDRPGFYTTRVLAFFLGEALKILAEGCPIADIDQALTDFGFPVGPMTLIDEVGIDIGLHVLETLNKQQMLDKPDYLDRLIEQGYLGRKSGKGFYRYRDGKKLAVDDNIYSIIKPQKTFPPANEARDLITDRCLLLFVNEAVKCLDEQIVDSALAGDVGAVFGLGFPPFWGGPFKYIDHVGCRSIVQNLNILRDKHGERFTPAPRLLKMADDGEKFFSSND